MEGHPCLRPIPNRKGTLGPCSGNRLIATSTDVFGALIWRDDFQNADGPTRDTIGTPFALWNLAKSAGFEAMFEESGWFTPSEAVELASRYRGELPLVGVTFIPYEVGEEGEISQRFVLIVVVCGLKRKLMPSVMPFPSSTYVREAGYGDMVITRPKVTPPP